MKGLQGKMSYNNYLTSFQRGVMERLAEIEREDADRCAECGGEDCICCEYYLDRQKWVEPDELFAPQPGDPMYDDYFFGRAVYDDEEEYEE